MLNYSTGDTHECDWCEKEFEWDTDDVIESYDEYPDGAQFVRWQVVCPNCEECTTVTQF